MHESIQSLIQRERIRRKEVDRFVRAVKPLMDDLRSELSSILAEYRKEFPDDGRIVEMVTLHSGLGLEIKRLPNGPRCEVYPDRVHRILRVTHSNSESFDVPVGYNSEGALELAAKDATISAFASAILAPILFPELIELGGSF